MERPNKLARFLYAVAFRVENSKGTAFKKFDVRSAIKLTLEIAGFGWLTFAGFQWDTIAGLVVAGLSCFALSWHIGGDDDTEPAHIQRLQRR